MAIYANGPDYQSNSASSVPSYIFLTRGYGGTAIAAGIVVKNPTIVNTGSVPVYIGNGTIASVSHGTATLAYVTGAGVALQPGQQMVIFGTAVTGTATTPGLNTFDLYGAVNLVGSTAIIQGGYATQTIVS
jgi:hypothetical protein